ncbi:glycosyltransferase family 2 protein [Hyphomicrobium sp.]|uniref:glycosyltransferase family 2 protein n=1 Tax=Hyphomicrobium sp. TaxID=82 RepID=UPI002D76C914|nr:glycosyltransferase family 2 protein [Hyphomicrobium sp.]HET6390999.1 glycosyltransferase family 2 protein [Hyphomicrobium sp.]
MNSPPAFERRSVTRDRLVSVLLPLYNAENYIGHSIRSLLRQTHENLEIIVIDDGSTDRSGEFVRDLAAIDSRIRYVAKTNSGIVDALNLGLTLARGVFIARQDADDISTPARIEKQVEYLIEHPTCIAVSGAHFHIDESGYFTGGRHYPSNRGSGDYTAYPAMEPYLPHPFLMMHASILKELKYRHTFHCEDSDLYWRAVRFGKLENMSEILGLYRIHTASISGASIIDGRIQAVYSQLAAISAARYDLMIPDLEFDPTLLAKCRKAKSLARIIDLFAPMLDPRELAYLRAASALKLVELSGFRPYRLEKEDLQFLKSNVNLKKLGGRENRRNARRAVRGYYRRQGLPKLIGYYAGL